MSDKERISSDGTYFFLFSRFAKTIIFSIIIIIAIFMFYGDVRVIVLLVTAEILVLFSLYFFLRNIVDVEMDDEFIYLTRFTKTLKVPYHNVATLSSGLLIVLGKRMWWMTFHEPVEFGRKIGFMPKMNEKLSFSNKAIEKLRSKINSPGQK